MMKYRCDELPGPVVSRSGVNCTDQTISLLFSLPNVQRSLKFGRSVNAPELITALPRSAAFWKSPAAARVR